MIKKNEIDENSLVKKFVGRIVSGAYYDMQNVRIATKNRIRDVINKKVRGIPFDAVEEKKFEEESGFEKKFEDKKLLKLWEELLKKREISESEYKYVLSCWDISDESEKIENKYKRSMMEYIKNEKVYNEFLKHVRGIGEVLSANLIKEFGGDCARYDTISKLWKHTGNHVVNGKSVRKCKGVELDFSPRLRTLSWKVSDCLLKSNKGFYRGVYDGWKEKYGGLSFLPGELLEEYGKPYKREDVKLTKLHVHNRALRKMRKLFLAHYWLACRSLHGLSVRSPYVGDKLGHTGIVGWEQVLLREKKV